MQFRLEDWYFYSNKHSKVVYLICCMHITNGNIIVGITLYVKKEFTENYLLHNCYEDIPIL